MSPDHTYLAVGHASGHINLFQFSSATRAIPARSAPPTTLAAVNSGRREGHLLGTRILHLGFVGKRHTAIVSGDESGLAFYHSLGRVLGVDSTDVLRILGSYPDPASVFSSPATPSTSSRGKDAVLTPPLSSPTPVKLKTTLFAALPLPYSKSVSSDVSSSSSNASSPALAVPHPTDEFHLSALLTPSKLLIVGLKPSPRTWHRRLRGNEGGEEAGRTGAAAWRVSSQAGRVDHQDRGSSSSRSSGEATTGRSGGIEMGRDDPVLAWCWGRVVRLLRVVVAIGGAESRSKQPHGPTKNQGDDKEQHVQFVEEGRWECPLGAVLGLEWLGTHVSSMALDPSLCHRL